MEEEEEGNTQTIQPEEDGALEQECSEEVEEREDTRAPPPPGIGHFWQRWEACRKYDSPRPCVGTGGMGSVWAMRRKDKGWVVAKIVPLGRGSGVYT